MDFQHYNESDLLLSGVLSHLKTIPYTEKNKEWQEWNLKVFKAVFGGGTTNPTILAIRDVSLRFLVENIDFFDLDGWLQQSIYTIIPLLLNNFWFN